MPKINFEKLLFDAPRIIWHLLFWVIFISFFSIVYGSFEENYALQFKLLLTDAIVQIPAVYICLYLLMPKFLFKEQYGAFFSSVLSLILIFSFLSWLDYIFIQHDLFWPNDPPMAIMNLGKILKSTTKIYPVVALAIVIKWFKYWYKEQKKTQLLQKEKLEAELKFLKAQVHPHFLFNTLNNLYALTLKQSKDAPEVVLKLSDLLDYMLYECNADVVPIKKEIKLVEDYIALEKIRYGKRLQVTFDIVDIREHLAIAPMLILPFVENCFKHGVSEALDDSWVSIHLSMKNEIITLKVENSKSINDNQSDRFEYKQGIGLKNVKRRLELIYPNLFDLNILDSEESFLVVLKLNLQGQQ